MIGNLPPQDMQLICKALRRYASDCAYNAKRRPTTSEHWNQERTRTLLLLNHLAADRSPQTEAELVEQRLINVLVSEHKMERHRAEHVADLHYDFVLKLDVGDEEGIRQLAKEIAR